MPRLTDFLRVVRAVSNWYAIIFVVLRLQRKVVVNFRNGLRFYYVNDLFSVEHFVEEPYRLTEVRGRIVVDVGAFTGNSAIYFACRGAKKVIAFEPVPETYHLAIENVKLNGFENIDIRNEELSTNEGEVFVDPMVQNHHSFSLVGRTSPTGVKVHTRTLSDVVSELGPDEAVIKLDCEGCEYDLLLKSDDRTILRFGQEILEAHSGTGSVIKRLRELGYLCKVMDIKGREVPEEGTHTLALLYASRGQEDLKAQVVGSFGFIGSHLVDRIVKEATSLAMQRTLFNG